MAVGDKDKVAEKAEAEALVPSDSNKECNKWQPNNKHYTNKCKI
ncbi:hypothetical protein SDC9_163813 [bioreactor metagenome]|uniref:Uncharacterized protein n=1 Tax=bioreactor metagenome TaxID=1076179 RepID=A0A645FSR3_9ZZZZ